MSRGLLLGSYGRRFVIVLGEDLGWTVLVDGGDAALALATAPPVTGTWSPRPWDIIADTAADYGWYVLERADFPDRPTPALGPAEVI